MGFATLFVWFLMARDLVLVSKWKEFKFLIGRPRLQLPPRAAFSRIYSIGIFSH